MYPFSRPERTRVREDKKLTQFTQFIGSTDGFEFPFPNSKLSGFSSGSWLPFLTLKNLDPTREMNLTQRTVHAAQKIGSHQTVR